MMKKQDEERKVIPIFKKYLDKCIAIKIFLNTPVEVKIGNKTVFLANNSYQRI